MDNSRRNFIKKATATGAAILAAPAVFGTAAAFRNSKKLQMQLHHLN